MVGEFVSSAARLRTRRHPTMCQGRCALVLASLIFSSSTHCATAEVEYHAVCDAGSTGTRLYIFEFDEAAGTAKAIFVKKTKPGLSAYEKDPRSAVKPVLELLQEGAQKVPPERRETTPCSIVGTAGVRMLGMMQQTSLWKHLSIGLTSAPQYPFSRDHYVGRTATGTEEGRWAVYNANFLSGRMGHDLLSRGTGAPLGLMDLGGSSTQIAIPAAGAAKKSVSFGTDAIIHSYLGFGMTHIREKVRETAVGTEDAVCYMKGTYIADGTFGTGDGPACRALLKRMIVARSVECKQKPQRTDECLGDLSDNVAAIEAIKGKVEFYAVAGMTYAVDFLKWWLSFNPEAAARAAAFVKAYPRPSLNELETAIDAVCAGEYAYVKERINDKARAHAYTGFDNAPYRCFQVNYIMILLKDMYGFPIDGHSLSFLLDLDGEDLEWPLGYMFENRNLVQERIARWARDAEL